MRSFTSIQAEVVLVQDACWVRGRSITSCVVFFHGSSSTSSRYDRESPGSPAPPAGSRSSRVSSRSASLRLLGQVGLG